MEKEDGVVNAFLRPDGYQGYYKVPRSCLPTTVEGTVQKRPRVLNVLAEGASGI
jgi:hypothetical protein